MSNPKIEYYTQPAGGRRTYVFASTFNADTGKLSFGYAVHRPNDESDVFIRRLHGASHRATALARLAKHPIVIQYAPLSTPPDEPDKHAFRFKIFKRKVGLMRNAMASLKRVE